MLCIIAETRSAFSGRARRSFSGNSSLPASRKTRKSRTRKASLKKRRKEPTVAARKPVSVDALSTSCQFHCWICAWRLGKEATSQPVDRATSSFERS